MVTDTKGWHWSQHSTTHTRGISQSPLCLEVVDLEICSVQRVRRQPGKLLLTNTFGTQKCIAQRTVYCSR